jgi:SAM-dependent methyltransferase
MAKSETAFTNEQFAHAYPVGIETHFWYVARNAIVLDTIRWIERREGFRFGRMLEIGCGRGIVVQYLRAKGRDCYGVELAPVSIPEPLKDYVWGGTDCLTLPETFRNQIELIFLLDVIEHVEDPEGFLASIRLAYPNCRWVIITVPARMELWSNFDREYGHFRRYDRAMLGDELKGAGAELVRSRYHFVPLYPLIYALVYSGRGRSTSNSAPSSRWLHRILGALIRCETWFCPGWVYGTSVLGVGRFTERAATVRPLQRSG